MLKMLKVIFKKSALFKTGEMLKMLKMSKFLGEPQDTNFNIQGSPQNFKIFNISPVLRLFGKQGRTSLTFSLF